jgi:fatty acid synthase subunit beta
MMVYGSILMSRNWVRQSSLQLFYDIIHGDLDPSTIFADGP